MGNENKNQKNLNGNNGAVQQGNQTLLKKLSKTTGKLAVLILLASQTSFFMSTNNTDNGSGEFSSRFVAEDANYDYVGISGHDVHSHSDEVSTQSNTTAQGAFVSEGIFVIETGDNKETSSQQFAQIQKVKAFRVIPSFLNISNDNLNILCEENKKDLPDLAKIGNLNNSSHCFSCLYADGLTLTSYDPKENTENTAELIEDIIREAKTKINSKCESLGTIDYDSLCSQDTNELASTVDSIGVTDADFNAALEGRDNTSSRSFRVVIASDDLLNSIKCHREKLNSLHANQSDDKNAEDISKFASILLESVELSESTQFLRNALSEIEKLYNIFSKGNLKSKLTSNLKNELKTTLLEAGRIVKAKIPMVNIKNELASTKTNSEKVKNDALAFINKYAAYGVNTSDLACLERKNDTSFTALWGLVNFNYSTNQQDQRCNYLSQSPEWRSIVSNAKVVNDKKSEFETRLNAVNTYDVNYNVNYFTELDIEIENLARFAPDIQINPIVQNPYSNPLATPTTNLYPSLYNPGQGIPTPYINNAHIQYPIPTQNVSPVISSDPNRTILNGVRASGSDWMSGFYNRNI